MPLTKEQVAMVEVIVARLLDEQPAFDVATLKHGGRNQLELRDIKGARLDSRASGGFNMNDLRWHGGGLGAGDFVPYTGATTNVDLGAHDLTLGSEGAGNGLIAPTATTNDTGGSQISLQSGSGLGIGGGGTLNIVSGDGGDTGTVTVVNGIITSIA